MAIDFSGLFESAADGQRGGGCVFEPGIEHGSRLVVFDGLASSADSQHRCGAELVGIGYEVDECSGLQECVAEIDGECCAVVQSSTDGCHANFAPRCGGRWEDGIDECEVTDFDSKRAVAWCLVDEVVDFD